VDRESLTQRKVETHTQRKEIALEDLHREKVKECEIATLFMKSA